MKSGRDVGEGDTKEGGVSRGMVYERWVSGVGEGEKIPKHLSHHARAPAHEEFVDVTIITLSGGSCKRVLRRMAVLCQKRTVGQIHYLMGNNWTI
ncbi:hypothetical protein BC936DRAFT_137026 [Jimgerdemannia flammicorona]|uniref:Uncharacterized protein n=1 Tax=Jimgerdemannia flammicorona TaxID=994334 RepID=A0A433CY90_9FUNG|nr:hypothetical protein BC936DRAFT_137026 [Jimgerdemannia flammicorona]